MMASVGSFAQGSGRREGGRMQMTSGHHLITKMINEYILIFTLFLNSLCPVIHHRWTVPGSANWHKGSVGNTVCANTGRDE